MSDFKNELEQEVEFINDLISRYLPDETGLDKKIREAMNYSVNAGGKRVRPMLMLEVYKLCGGDDCQVVYPFMVALECIHSYSLVHDDLPAMDNDDYRRGRLTTHKVFGEDFGILAGDGLLNLAYEIMAEALISGEGDMAAKAKAMEVIARKAGIKIATGEYIAYVDGDDWIAPTLYMELYEKGLQYGVDIVSCSGYIKYYSDDFKQVIKNNLGNGLYYKEEFEKKVFPHLINTECFYNTEIPLSLWAHVFKRKLLYDNQMRIDNIIRMAEDLICVSFCFMDARYVALTDVCGYYYRLTLESMTQNHFEDEDERIERLYTQYIERIYELSYEKIFLKKLKFAMIYIFLISNYGRLMRSEDETLFPFSKVKKGNQIIVYGAGAFGKELVRFLKKDNRFNLVAWVDAAYKKYQEQGMNIRSPEEVLNIEFDYLVIAVTKEKIAKQICRDLANRGIDVTKVQEMDLQMINNMNNPLGI